MKMNEMMTPESFFNNVDWTMFYKEKMALCETIDLLQDVDTEKAKNAISWIDGIINMMDAMGDVAENLGLFEYPERDDDDRCYDEQYNDILLRTPDTEAE